MTCCPCSERSNSKAGRKAYSHWEGQDAIIISDNLSLKAFMVLCSLVHSKRNRSRCEKNKKSGYYLTVGQLLYEVGIIVGLLVWEIYRNCQLQCWNVVGEKGFRRCSIIWVKLWSKHTDTFKRVLLWFSIAVVLHCRTHDGQSKRKLSKLTQQNQINCIFCSMFSMILHSPLCSRRRLYTNFFFTYAIVLPKTWKQTLKCKIDGVPL